MVTPHIVLPGLELTVNKQSWDHKPDAVNTAVWLFDLRQQMTQKLFCQFWLLSSRSPGCGNDMLLEQKNEPLYLPIQGHSSRDSFLS